MKIKFDSDNDLTPNKMIGIHVVVRAIFYENSKCYPQVIS